MCCPSQEICLISHWSLLCLSPGPPLICEDPPNSRGPEDGGNCALTLLGTPLFPWGISGLGKMIKKNDSIWGQRGLFCFARFILQRNHYESKWNYKGIKMVARPWLHDSPRLLVTVMATVRGLRGKVWKAVCPQHLFFWARMTDTRKCCGNYFQVHFE